MTARVHSFPPVVSPKARLLVLGSMPGIASLDAQQYYAHPRNAFWAIMQTLFGIDAQAPYPQRIAQLRDHGIALWDVAGSCIRPGSLDSAIDASSVQANDFAALLRAYPTIHTIAFNGRSVQQLFQRHALPQIPAELLPATRLCLPSTSPANARVSLQQKVQAWRDLQALLH